MTAEPVGAPRPTIQVIGESLMDIIIDPLRGVRETPGGSPLNVAIGLGRLGHNVQLLTSLGDDDFGARMIDHLCASGVKLDRDSMQTASTSTATARILPDGSAQYVFDASWDLPPPVRSALPPNSDLASIVHTGSLAALVEPGRDATLDRVSRSRSHALVSFDPNVRPGLGGERFDQLSKMEEFFALSDVIKLSDEDAEWLYPGRSHRQVLDRLLGAGAVLVAITRGARGALMSSVAGTVEVAADTGGVVDTVGAGDSFMAGMIHVLARMIVSGVAPDALRRGDHLQMDAVARIVDCGKRCSSITVRRRGADLPWIHELR